ncbi:hypothetical protein KKH39_05005 [Patescibacteria group bacterium]|nr:hypothetical protein [Patescibacteria group bacterium]
MFEHLGPTPETYRQKKVTNFKVYLSLLLMAIFVFVFSLSLKEGPVSGAYGVDSARLSAKVLANTADKKIVYQANNFSVFDFIIETEKDNISLQKLEVRVDGLYDLSLIDDLKIFHDGMQLGEVKEIDQSGHIYFDLEDYPLKKGQNLFRFLLPNNNVVNTGDVLQLSIENDWDVFLSYQEHLFTPDGQFPVQSGLISFVEKGQILASNQYIDNNFLINTNIPQQLSRFSLTTDSETFDVYKVIVAYEALGDTRTIDKADFVLLKDGQLLSQASLDDQSSDIIFYLNKPIFIQNNGLEYFDLHTLALPTGQYKFYLKNVSATGSVSGQDLSLHKDLYLSTVDSRDYFLQINSPDQNKRLSQGWNELYRMKLTARGVDSLELNKLTFAVDKYGLDISRVDVLIDDEPYIADIVIENNKIIIKSDIQNPIKISDKGNEISLLVKVDNLDSSAKLSARLLTDDQPISEDRNGNIIWSSGDIFFNSYMLPYLPLEPSILSY